MNEMIAKVFSEYYAGDVELKAPASIRKSALDVVHARTAPFTSMSIRIVFQNPKHLLEFIHRRTDLRLPSVSTSRISVERSQLFSAALLQEIVAWNAKQDRKVAFQIDRLLWNCTLDAREIVDTVLPLVEELLKVSSEHAEATLIELIGGEISTKAEAMHFEPDGDWEDDEVLPGRAKRENIDQEITDAILRAARMVETVEKSARDAIPLCRHINITPTGLFLDACRDGEDNSILRRYEDVGQFIRVSMCEEDVTMLRSNATQDIKTLLSERCKPLLLDGLAIAGRQYEFLGWSQSALREHSVWFVCQWRDRDGSMVSASSILAGLGNFDRVGNIPGQFLAESC